MEINKGQKEAIYHVSGPMIVLAGPGSGKTFVITQRTKYLVEECKIPEENILVITFTKAAAVEMKERYIKLLDNKQTKVSFGTFHGTFFTILKHAYGYNAANIIREEVKKQFIKELIHKHNPDFEDENEMINLVSAEISLVKGDKLDINHYYSRNCSEDSFRRIYKEYESRLKANRLIDFDDMLVMTYDLFVKEERYLHIWQNKFKYILIDEFQDINIIQYKIIQMLVKPEKNIFIVGDDDQSIYKFRGARPEIMQQFLKDYPNSKQALLDKNYRSNENIVKAALRLVKNNSIRFEKDIEPSKKKGHKIEVINFDNINQQNKNIVEKIKSYNMRGMNLKDIAILVRMNKGHHNLLYTLLEYNIPFVMKDIMPNIYEHWIAQDIIAYIKIANGEHKRSNYLRIINKPKRYISRECFDSPDVDLEDIIKYYEDKYWMLERIDDLDKDLIQLSRMSPYAAITYIRRGIDYESYLKEYSETRRINFDELIDILDELQESAKKFKTIHEWFEHMIQYKKELEKQANDNKNIDAINVLTIHSSKGLEYEAVFIIDVNEDIIPHKKALSDVDIEEERRLFYVGMTRAKEYLHLYSSKEKYNKELEPSRFLYEIEEI